MNDQEARSLRRGDRILISGMRAVVTNVARYAGPLGSAGPLFIDFEFMDGGTGRASGDFIKDIEKLPAAAPTWWDDLMKKSA